jgi:C4-dicarboxylate transporter DctM subunit
MRILDHLEEWFIAALMGVATVIVFLAVLHRYLSGIAIPGLQDWLLSLNFSWAQEATIYLFVWMAKFGAAYGVRTGIHVGVDVFINRMKDRNRARFVLLRTVSRAYSSGHDRHPRCRFVLGQRRPPRDPRGAPGLNLDLGLDRADDARSRVADVGHLSRHPARLGADVLSLHPGRVELLAHRCAAQARPFVRRRPRRGHADGRRSARHMNGVILFGLLVALMLTGMPISIALGLTVLTFIFGFTEVPVQSVALKLFTGLENFEIMAIPFFILAGNFLTHGGVARRMIAFATSLVGHW